MRFLFIVLLAFTLNSCGNLMSASLIESFLTPTSAIMSVADYGIEKETGKKFSEHALSIATSKDCKFNLKDMTICKDENISSKKILKVTKFIKCSSSLKFCLIASGEFDIYAATARAKEWDIAAGHAIAEHAGAILTTFNGRKITYGKKNFSNPSMILKRSNNLLK